MRRFCLGAARLTAVFATAAALAACQQPGPETSAADLVAIEIGYRAPEASVVELGWGVDGWNVPALPDSVLPGGTREVDGVLRTPMVRAADRFVTTVRVPRSASVDFGFLITGATDRLLPAPLWDGTHAPLSSATTCCPAIHEAVMPDSLRRSVLSSSVRLVTRAVRYQGTEADSVVLVWGIDGWQSLPEGVWPPGTSRPGPVMRTSMVRAGPVRSAELRVPAGGTLEYGFLVFGGPGAADSVGAWVEGETGRSVGTAPSEVIEFDDDVAAATDLSPAGGPPVAMAAHEIRYVAPGAGQVLLVWGVNGWGVVDEALRPPDTEIADGVMRTPMRREADAFVAELRVRSDARIDYGFLITHDAVGKELQPVWDEDAAVPLPAGGGVTRVEAGVDLGAATRLPTIVGVVALVLAGVFAWVLVSLALTRLPRTVFHTAAALAALTLVGFALRAGVAASTERLGVSSPELIGDETRYDFLATSVVEGRFFEVPLATPVYPLFLAAHYEAFGHRFAPVLYTQALLGALLVPLVYLLGRLTTGRDAALAAAALTAFLPALVDATGYLYTEVVFTVLLLAAMVALVWALRAPAWGRFAAAGALVGLAALTRPSIAMWPLALPLLLPRTWSLRQRGRAWVAYGVAAALVVAPWTYHNYRTLDTFLPLSLTMATLWHGSPEFYHVMESGDNAMVTVWANELNPALNGGHDPMTVEGDRYFSARARDAIRAEPGLYVLYSLQKLAYFWVGHPAAAYEWPFDWPLLRDSMSTAEIAYLYGSRFVLLFGTLFAAFLLRRRFLELSPLLLLCLYFMAVHAVLVPVVRHSVPLYPLLAVVTAAGLTGAWRRPRDADSGADAAPA